MIDTNGTTGWGWSCGFIDGMTAGVIDAAREWRRLDIDYNVQFEMLKDKYGWQNMGLPQVSEVLVPLMNQRDAARVRLCRAIDALNAKTANEREP